jgi:predicted dehydrogenase
MGQVHSRAWARLLHHYPGAALEPRPVAVADTDAGRREQARDAYGFQAVGEDWRALVARPDVDVVSIAGPNFVHREVAVAAARAGKHVWVEKPVGRHLADTRDVAEAVRVAGVRSAVGFNYRNAPAVDLARRLVTEGRIGTIETVGVRLFSDYAAHPDGALSWRFDPALAGTGVIGDLASHGLDLVRHVVGASAGEIGEVVADRATFITQRPEPVSGAVSHYTTAAGGPTGPVGNEDHVSVLLRFTGGARGVLECSRVAVGEQCTYGIDVHGDRGALAWDFRRMGELRLAADEGYTDAAWRTVVAAPGAGDMAAFQPGAGIAMGYDDLKVVEAERLVRSIAEGRPHGATVEDALVTATAADAIGRSAVERRWVTL